MNLKPLAIVVLAAGLSACWNRGFVDDKFLTSTDNFASRPPLKMIKTEDASRVQVTAPMEGSRKVSEVDCSRSYTNDGGNLSCR